MDEALKRQRREFVLDGPCAKCGGRAHDCHEILAGALRHRSVKVRACWLRLCRMCHMELQGTDIIYQLAYKLVSDPEGFNIPEFCEAWARTEKAVSADELLSRVQQVLLERGGHE